jgi:hypothetical protein
MATWDWGGGVAYYYFLLFHHGSSSFVGQLQSKRIEIILLPAYTLSKWYRRMRNSDAVG